MGRQRKGFPRNLIASNTAPKDSRAGGTRVSTLKKVQWRAKEHREGWTSGTWTTRDSFIVGLFKSEGVLVSVHRLITWVLVSVHRLICHR